MKMRSKMGTGVVLVAGAMVFSPQASADQAKPAMVDVKPTGKPAVAELSLDAVVDKHLAALGGADLLRTTKTMTYAVTGEMAGKKFSKTVRYARPGKIRIDLESADGSISKGFDGKVAWMKKGAEAAVAMNAEATAAMKSEADFDEPLLDYARRGDAVKLIGKSEISGAPAYDLELTKAHGEVEHHFLDAATFLLVKRAWTGKYAGKTVTMAAQFADFKAVQGRMVAYSIEFGTDTSAGKSTVTQVAYDKPIDAAVFALPRK
jgi:hypothetical protein